MLFIGQGASSGEVSGAAVCTNVLYTGLYSCLLSRLAADPFSQSVQLPNQCLQTLGTSVPRSSRSAFGRPTGNDVSGHYIIFFPFFFPSSTFLIEGALGSKNLFREFWAPRRPFWIFEVLIEGMIESKKLI